MKNIITASDLYSFIDKWRINQAILAAKMGMLKGTFNNKLNPNHYTKFSELELKKLKGILLNLKNELENVKI